MREKQREREGENKKEKEEKGKVPLGWELEPHAHLYPADAGSMCISKHPCNMA